MAFTDLCLAALAQYLAAGGVGTWRPADPYLPTDPTPIILSAVPSTPDRILVLTPYPVSDSVTLSDSVLGVQVGMRGDRDPRTVQALSDAVFDRLHGAQAIGFAGGQIVACARQSETPLGTDGNDRHERTANYYLSVWRPSPNRT